LPKVKGTLSAMLPEDLASDLATNWGRATRNNG
jgi:hypothetical protein